MKTTDIKDIWQSKVDTKIKPYSDAELNELVVKSARKAMKTIHPGWILRLIIYAVSLYLIINLAVGNDSLGLKLIDLGALLILSISYLVWERSAHTMNKFARNSPVKEWLEYRIREVEKDIRIKSRYGILIYAGAIILGFSIPFTSWLLTNSFHAITALITFSIILAFVLTIRFRFNKNYTQTLKELKELHNQLEVAPE
ncbi:hypothetical protein [Sunxiuqinia elliptica]|uniref:Uncharacterized protein n=1 Tax=Sunxiuqinia elliptica TaxID=655355 RepID=A0A4R6HAD0_9BACT|nr:hypothetical protein [Sunxiuqinia elliptica]TDO05322.1 hypothetical protein DET52_101678 [Sunxiuqinia elliptica]TDO64871.1 hypothetical protein DET65_1237 [Sunxiuqinia elliptica]